VQLETLVMALELSDPSDYARLAAMTRKYHLTTAFLYLFVNGLDEFVMPLRDLYALYANPALKAPVRALSSFGAARVLTRPVPR